MLGKSLFYYLFFISIFLSSCEFHCSVGESEEKKETGKKYKPVQKDGALLYNGIHLVSRGVQVEKAYLVTDDEQEDRVGEDNFVEILRGVKMYLLIKDGWKDTDGRVRIDASMKAVADDGTVIAEEQNMFKEYEEKGISIEESKSISIALFVNKWTASRPVTVKISFRVWDKQSDAFVEGDYTVHTK
jgi:hypothetical protein